MLQSKILIPEVFPINGFVSKTILTSNVTPLNQNARDDTMNLGAFVAKAFFARAEASEVLAGHWNYGRVQFNHKSTNFLGIRPQYKEASWCWIISRIFQSSLLVFFPTWK